MIRLRSARAYIRVRSELEACIFNAVVILQPVDKYSSCRVAEKLQWGWGVLSALREVRVRLPGVGVQGLEFNFVLYCARWGTSISTPRLPANPVGVRTFQDHYVNRR